MRKIILSIALLGITFGMNSQNQTIGLNYSFGFNPDNDNFTYNGASLGNYALGWYMLTSSAEARLSGYGGIKLFTNKNPRLTISYNGNVGIGTINPDMKLTVKGNIHAEEVKIDLNVPAPDYVFKKDYYLRSIEEVEDFIKENSHLPEIPSAKEFEQNGIMQAEMDMNLLKKIEELTLYTIQQEKKINKLEKENESLKLLATQFEALQKRLEKLENSK
ncbi:tail fiber protein [Flavivirga eckloniae]|uniref:Uncharacterized protein n=1 Tax=Flavivirga eckloniae TaxID=1803846 RepID=A0A2K9PQA3_9FLAO|nr:tail fiber protein [Flavivirga eckloniae]AUP79253.1 hypothetical protein C1H87_11270 [Flavivirga eckloniae]